MTVTYEALCHDCDWYGRSNSLEWFHTLVDVHMDEHLGAGITTFDMVFRQRKGAS